MNIAGKITGLKYKILLSDELKKVDIKDFDINEIPFVKDEGAIDNFSSEEKISVFVAENKISASQQTLIETVFAEARENNFVVRIQFSR